MNQKILLFVIILKSAFGFCQTFNYDEYRKKELREIFNVEVDELSPAYFELKGNIKKVITKEMWISDNQTNKKVVQYLFNDTIRKVEIKNSNELKFNRFGKLTHVSSHARGKKFPSKIYRYNKNGRLVKSQEYFSGIVWLTEKFVYNKKNQLIQKRVKSRNQHRFFIKEKYEFDSLDRLIKKFDINNHIETNPLRDCEWENDKDYITNLIYDGNKLVKSRSTFFEYKSNSNKSSDETLFFPYDSILFEYDSNNRLIKEHLKTKYILPNINQEHITSYKYTNDSLSEKATTILTNNRIDFKTVIDLIYDENGISSVERKYIDDSVEIPMVKYYLKNKKIYKFENYTNGKLTDTNHYDSNENIVLEQNENYTCYYKIEYDSNNNWTKFLKYDNANHKLIGLIVREITYY